ncbi:MAG TPA: HAMP domain-containing protein, partial [Dehalococcoidia bacterium]|nr:HAMP domain-containing protein [Dehalococcoidia bacterium]
MTPFGRRSIVFRLWLRLSFITIAVALFALGAYVWVEVQDNFSAAEAQAHNRADAMFAASQRFASDGTAPVQAETEIADSLDVVAVDVLDANGHVTRSLGTLSAGAARRSIDQATLNQHIAGGPSSSEVQFDVIGAYTPVQIETGDLLNGGQFGAEYFYPMSQIVPGSSGAVRIIATFPGVANEAQTLALRSMGLVAVIVCAMIFAMWILLNALVARPLRSYSDAAMRIASGEMVRMPVMALDEMGNLGQAINGMADALGYQATVDPLTGLYTLRHLTSRLENLMDEAKLNRGPLALIVCDLDNLKPI